MSKTRHEVASSRTGGFVCLLAYFSIFAGELFTIVRQHSLSWDEDDHIFSGYMPWKTADFGSNPEHSPRFPS